MLRKMDTQLWENYQEVMMMRKEAGRRYKVEAVRDEDRLVRVFAHTMPDKDEFEIRAAIRKVFQYYHKSIPQVQLVNEVLKELKM